ncbi:MAG: pyruvoyl-dependent arginine decarboxylase [Frankiaceae bacterium]
MEIRLAAGAGAGPTTLAAYDAALREIGVANHNLIRLSSVIPPGSVLTQHPGSVLPPGGWGDRLYVVTADARTDLPGTDAWAGVGWAQDPHTGRGLFVEHEGHSEAQVTADIAATLTSMRRGRGTLGEQLTDQQMLVSGISCTDEPVCAVVVAVFGAESWPCPALQMPPAAGLCP